MFFFKLLSVPFSTVEIFFRSGVFLEKNNFYDNYFVIVILSAVTEEFSVTQFWLNAFLILLSSQGTIGYKIKA